MTPYQQLIFCGGKGEVLKFNTWAEYMEWHRSMS